MRARAISSSTSRNRSLPKKISLPTKKVGPPNAPRATDSWVFFNSRSLTSGSAAPASREFGVEAGRRQYVAHDLGIVHLLLIGPYRLEHRIDVAREHALALRGDRTPA